MVGVFRERKLYQPDIKGFPNPEYDTFPTLRQADKWLAAQHLKTVLSNDEDRSEEDTTDATSTDDSEVD
jgi:viroplasmin and RNaseH domain-containing protein